MTTTTNLHGTSTSTLRHIARQEGVEVPAKATASMIREAIEKARVATGDTPAPTPEAKAPRKTAHSDCDHPRTPAARAICRKERAEAAAKAAEAEVPTEKAADK
ncbi:hypothetical protein [Granulicoccus sp. GXG6511]|uniref:hypothetical protein n=1 Tax=Granulicoccus sp. GXG6511 TaxID=3381351 RepID=UPI003D7CDB14